MQHSQAPELRELAKRIRQLMELSNVAGTAAQFIEPACQSLELQAFYFDTLHRGHAREQGLVGYGGDG